MKPILLMFPGGAGGDFIAGLHLLYNYNIHLFKGSNNQWGSDSSDNCNMTNRIDRHVLDTIVTTGHIQEGIINAHYTNHTRTQIVADCEWIEYVATAYVLKSEMAGNDTGNGSERISIARATLDSIPITGFCLYKYSELFDDTHSTIPHLLASWGTVVPDQEVLQHLIQYYNKCNINLFDGIPTKPITFKDPADIMNELRRVRYID